MDLKSTYNRIARDWERDHHADTWWIEGTEKFLSFLAPGASILDIGCGAGEKSKYLVNKGFEVIGFDFSEEMVRLATEQVQKAVFLVKDIRHPLDFSRSFDGVFAQAVLLHIPKKEVIEVLKNIISPLKTGGYFYAAVKEIKSNGPEEEILTENDYGCEYERFFSYFTLDEVKHYLQECDLKLVYKNITTSGKTNWIQIVAGK